MAIARNLKALDAIQKKFVDLDDADLLWLQQRVVGEIEDRQSRDQTDKEAE